MSIDLVEQMRQEDNLAMAARLKTDLIQYIEQEPYRFQGRFYNQYILVLLTSSTITNAANGMRR